jgi:hypothetical protein
MHVTWNVTPNIKKTSESDKLEVSSSLHLDSSKKKPGNIYETGAPPSGEI